MINEAIEGIQDLFVSAERNVAELFNDPWPPVDYHFHNRAPFPNPPTVFRPHHQYIQGPLLARSHRTQTVTRTKITTTRRTVSSVATRVKTSTAVRPPSTSVTPHVTASTKARASPASALTSPRHQPKGSLSDTSLKSREPPRRSSSSLPISRPILASPTQKPKRSPVPRLTAEDIKIDVDRCDVLVIAIAEMEICKEIFAGWSAQLDLAEPHKNGSLESLIVTEVHKLNDDANSALRSSHSLIHSYRMLVHLTEKRLRSISLSKSGGSLYTTSSEYEKLTATIATHSSALTTRVKLIQERLRNLVLDIEKTKDQARRRALRRRIWGWLVKTFRAISLLISAGGAIFALFHPLGLLDTAAITVASMLSGAVAKLCEITQKKYDETTFDEILVFMRDHVPESAKAAEIALTNFQACHRVLQVELDVRQGRRVDWLSAREANAAHPAWSLADAKLKLAIKREAVPPLALPTEVATSVQGPGRHKANL